MSAQERNLDAAEYVIGTLSQAERVAFEETMRDNPTSREDVMFWERTFGALNASISPQSPPEDLWQKIEAALPDAAAETEQRPRAVVTPTAAADNDNEAQQLRRSLNRWRISAIAASVATIGLGIAVLGGPGGPLGEPTVPVAGKLDGKEYIAVVNATGDQPSLVVSINAETGDVTVRSVGMERPAGKSLELWYVPDGEAAVSVGLVGEGNIDLKNLKANDGDLLAISLEPQGGSPTGVATGPVIYTGKLIENVNPK